MSAGNTFGKLLKITLFGESHGAAVGAVIDGFPSGIEINFSLIEKMLKLRSPSNTIYETSRKEADKVEFLSGVSNNITLGTPIAFIVRNTNVNPSDYAEIKNIFRPGHADFVYHKKYKTNLQSGGGRASGRETVARVVAGALALDFLKSKEIDIISYVSSIGNIKMEGVGRWFSEEDVCENTLHCPDGEARAKMDLLLKDVVSKKDSIGGIVTTVVSGLPIGLGEPVFGKISSLLSNAIFSIPGVKGVEFGDGFESASMLGSEYNDIMNIENDNIYFETNHCGGIQAGITNGNNLIVNTAFRPASSIGIEQKSVDISGNKVNFLIKGRHDVCYVPRAAVIVTSMAALTIADLWFQYKSFNNK